MQDMTHTLRTLILLACTLLLCSGTRAGYVLVEDFNALGSGDIHGQNGWTNDGVTEHTKWEVTADPTDAGNQVLVGLVNNKWETYTNTVAKSYPSVIAEGATGTLFMRIRAANRSSSDQVRTYAGASPVAANLATDDADLANYLLLQEYNSTPPASGLYVEHGGGNQNVVDLDGDTWYLMWLVYDNQNDAMQVYLEEEGSGVQVQLSDGGDAFFEFGSPTTEALASVIFTMKRRDHDISVYYDDIYIDVSGVNLTNPIPEPTSLALLLGPLAVALTRRRRIAH